jgi:hypothetical protein
MLEKGQFEAYQRYQGSAIFDCEYVVLTIGDESNKVLFYNVYKVIGTRKAKEVQISNEYIFHELIAEIIAKNGYYYGLQKMDGFDDLSNRVLIEWDVWPSHGINGSMPKVMLSSVAGVYLIIDTTTGNQPNVNIVMGSFQSIFLPTSGETNCHSVVLKNFPE